MLKVRISPGFILIAELTNDPPSVLEVLVTVLPESVVVSESFLLVVIDVVGNVEVVVALVVVVLLKVVLLSVVCPVFLDVVSVMVKLL